MRQSYVAVLATLLASAVVASPSIAKVPPGQAGQDNGPRPPGLIGGGHKKDSSTCYDSTILFDVLVTAAPTSTTAGVSYATNSTDGSCTGGQVGLTTYIVMSPENDFAAANALCLAAAADTRAVAMYQLGYNTPTNYWACVQQSG